MKPLKRLSTRSLSFIILAVAIISGTALSLSFRVSAQTAAGKVPLTHETMWLMKRVGAPNPSPDGKWVVFRSNLRGPIHVYAVEVAKAK